MENLERLIRALASMRTGLNVHMLALIGMQNVVGDMDLIDSFKYDYKLQSIRISLKDAAEGLDELINDLNSLKGGKS